MSHDPHAEVEVAGQPSNDYQLLVVLLAEDGHVGSCGSEQFGDHGGDAVEVSGSGGSLHQIRQSADADGRREAVGIHRCRRRHVDHVCASVVAGPEVGVEWSRVLLEVAALAELERVDEDRDDHTIRVRSSSTDQIEMAAVQRSHRGDEGECLTGRAGGVRPCARRTRRVDDSGHGCNASASALLVRGGVAPPTGRGLHTQPRHRWWWRPASRGHMPPRTCRRRPARRG